MAKRKQKKAFNFNEQAERLLKGEITFERLNNLLKVNIGTDAKLHHDKVKKIVSVIDTDKNEVIASYPEKKEEEEIKKDEDNV